MPPGCYLLLWLLTGLRLLVPVGVSSPCSIYNLLGTKQQIPAAWMAQQEQTAAAMMPVPATDGAAASLNPAVLWLGMKNR